MHYKTSIFTNKMLKIATSGDFDYHINHNAITGYICVTDLKPL